MGGGEMGGGAEKESPGRGCPCLGGGVRATGVPPTRPGAYRQVVSWRQTQAAWGPQDTLPAQNHLVTGEVLFST